MRSQAQPTPATLTVHVPLTFTVRGGRETIIGTVPHETPTTRFDDSIAKALARAWRWRQKLDDGTYANVTELLAPEIVEAALDGRTSLTVESLTKLQSPNCRMQRSNLRIT